MKKQRGFTLLEISLVMAIIAILAGISMPLYRDYTERARLAAVLVQYDAIREQATIAAAGSGRDLCKWQVQLSNLRTPDQGTLDIKTMAQERLAALDPKRWTPNLNRYLDMGDKAAGPLLIQFGGTGADGARRARLLEQEFVKIGKVYTGWTPAKSTPLFHSFAVMMGDCGGGAGGIVTASITAVSPAAGAASPPAGPASSPSTITASAGAKPRATCAAAEQSSADGSSCEPKVCASGQVLNTATGQCASPPAPQVASKEPQGDQITRMCQVCGENGPDVCDIVYERAACTYPKNYCTNTINNLADGTKTVNRQCSNFQDMYRNWYVASSDMDECQTYFPDRVVNREFQCTFGCTTDDCNFDLKPSKETLWQER